jgi:hypothetical protein
MKPRLLVMQEASDAPGASEQPCPRCAGNLIRIRRRVIDRLLSLFVPVRLYVCAPIRVADGKAIYAYAAV